MRSEEDPCASRMHASLGSLQVNGFWVNAQRLHYLYILIRVAQQAS